MARRLLASVTLLLLAACLTPSPARAPRPWTVSVDGTVPPRLPTAVRHGLFLTSARIGEREAGPFLIDSGASDLILDVKLADALNLKSRGTGTAPGLKQMIKLATLDSVVIGPVSLRNTPVAIMDLSPVTEAFGQPLAGVLGHAFFARTIVEIDYARLSVSCFDPASYRLTRGAWQSLTLLHNVPGLSARLEGNAEGLFLLDTGSTGTVNFFASFVQRARLVEIRKISKAKFVRWSGEYDMFMGKIGWFELAGHRFDQPSVSFIPPNTPDVQRLDGFDGIIGVGFMRAFLVVFNYPESKVALLR